MRTALTLYFSLKVCIVEQTGVLTLGILFGTSPSPDARLFSSRMRHSFHYGTEHSIQNECFLGDLQRSR